jgi:hypothetical protein
VLQETSFSSPYVVALAVNTSGNYAWPGSGIFVGVDPSGEHGLVGGVQRKLVAYITEDRRNVRARFFDASMQQLNDILVYHLPSGWAYQTATAYQANDGKWLIAWTEVDQQVTHMARPMQRTVDGQYQLGPAPDPLNPALPCDYGLSCYGGESVPESGPLIDHCMCKSLWLASSSSSTTPLDRYRMFTYGFDDMARLSSAGAVVAVSAPGGTWSPFTELKRVTTPSGIAIYQRLRSNYPSSLLQYFVEGSASYVSQSDVISAPLPEAFRAESKYVAVGVASDHINLEPDPAVLKLSVVPTGDPAYYCPP